MRVRRKLRKGYLHDQEWYLGASPSYCKMLAALFFDAWREKLW